MFIYNQLILHGRVLHEKQTASQSRNSAHFMKPEGSLPHLQAPAICPFPEPDQSIPRTPNSFLNIHLILSSTLLLVLPSGLFPSRFSTKTYHIYI